MLFCPALGAYWLKFWDRECCWVRLALSAWILAVPAAPENRRNPGPGADFPCGHGQWAPAEQRWEGGTGSAMGSAGPGGSFEGLAQGDRNASTSLARSGDAVRGGRVLGLGGRRTPGGGFLMLPLRRGGADGVPPPPTPDRLHRQESSHYFPQRWNRRPAEGPRCLPAGSGTPAPCHKGCGTHQGQPWAQAWSMAWATFRHEAVLP